MKYFYQVAILNHNLKLLTYSSNIKILPGERVWVQIKQQKKLAIIVEQVLQPEIKNIKPITRIDNEPCLPEQLLALAKWMSNYYLTPIAEVLGLMLPTDGFAKANLINATTSQTIRITPLGMIAKSASAAQKKLLSWMQENQGYIITQASCQDSGFKPATILACLARNWLEVAEYKTQTQGISLSSEQQRAVQAILEKPDFQVFLLAGVTGSGKTEVYCQVISDVIAKGKQALVLVPEIGLTKQTVARFVARCGVPALVLHSKITAKQKIARWQAAFSGKGSLIIGTRSSLFAPLKNLGVIVIDESHDASFKQQNICLYSAKHTAIMLAKIHNIPIVLGSATPALDSLHNCAQGNFKLLELTAKAFGNNVVTSKIINSCSKQKDSGIVRSLKNEISAAIEQKSQVLVFVNRRGYAPVMLCELCGSAEKCQSCDSNYVLHQQPYNLQCHHCAKIVRVPERCQNCGAKSWSMPGLGTQKVFAQMKEWFPSKNVLRIDRDNIKSPADFNTALDAINAGAAEIVVGTQMLAKGHDFNNVGLVLILDCDAQLYNPDYVAVERLAQLLVQVAGRTGRRTHKGKVILQTYQPHHPVFQVFDNGYRSWAEHELMNRRAYDLVPFTYSLNIHIQSQSIASLHKIRRDFSHVVYDSRVRLIGPVSNMQPKRKGFWRDIIMLSAGQRNLLINQAHSIQAQAYNFGWNKIAQIKFDVDPIAST